MSSDNASETDPEQNAPNGDIADQSAELDGAIDGLRDVLQQDAEGLKLPTDTDDAGELPDIGGDFSGGSDFGSDFAAGDLAGTDAAGGDALGDFGGDFGSDFAAGGLDDNALGADTPGMDFGAAGGGDLGLDTAAPTGAGGGSNVTGATGSNTRADLIMNIPVEIQVVLGKSQMQVSELMELNEGATIGLDRKIGEAVEIVVNGKLIGRGEITLLENDDTRFGVKMIEVLGSRS